MATNRKVIFANKEIYHVYNRGVERRTVFTNKKEYQKAIDLIRYYRLTDLPMRYSQFRSLPVPTQETVWGKILKENRPEIVVIAYCLMPNHFHIVLRQSSERGITRFMANLSNSFTKYFNKKYRRVGSLFQGPFKAKHVETEEQLLHLTRYVHLNPVASFLLKLDDLESYPWSSFSEYLREDSDICEIEWIKTHFPKTEQHKKFVYDQADYAQKLEKIKHIALAEN